MCPSDVFLPLAVAFPERDIKGISPKSIFNIGKSHKARQHAEHVGEFIFDQLELKCPTLGHAADSAEG